MMPIVFHATDSDNSVTARQHTPVEFILAGYEQGGTTLLSDLFRANGFESGFECGVLLGETPADMPKVRPYWDMLPAGWRISEATRSQAITGDVADFYRILKKSAFPDFDGPLFDKTPKYMLRLGTCLDRAPFLKGAVVIHRDPRAVFVSMSKRLSPGLDAAAAVEKNFGTLEQRYLSYFIGSIAHLDNAKVLFVPFEELVSRESAWLKALGLFVRGTPFQAREKTSRFANVAGAGMELGKITEFNRLLPPALQKRILEATRLASPFFASPVERADYGDLWHETSTRARKLMQRFGLPATGARVDGTYFEPLTYLIRYPDILAAGVNPVDHYHRRGRFERRNPA